MCGINERQILKTRLSRLLRMSKLDFLAFFVSGLHCSHEQSEKKRNYVMSLSSGTIWTGVGYPAKSHPH